MSLRYQISNLLCFDHLQVIFPNVAISCNIHVPSDLPHYSASRQISQFVFHWLRQVFRAFQKLWSSDFALIALSKYRYRHLPISLLFKSFRQSSDLFSLSPGFSQNWIARRAGRSIEAFSNVLLNIQAEGRIDLLIGQSTVEWHQPIQTSYLLWLLNS